MFLLCLRPEGVTGHGSSARWSQDVGTKGRAVGILVLRVCKTGPRSGKKPLRLAVSEGSAHVFLIWLPGARM